MKNILVAAISAVLFGGTGAVAADLGGNCCADLEERVAELEATTARKGNRKLSLKIYGQVNQAILHHDIEGLDGADDITIVDNQLSTSRLGVRGEAKVRSDFKVGYRLELGINAGADDAVSLRHSYAYLEMAFGRVSIGHTSRATDNLTEISVANVQPASKMLNIDVIKSIPGVAVGLPFDGGRANIVRYDTPVAGGLRGTVAYGEDAWDAAIRWAQEIGAFQVAAGVGVRSEDDVFIGDVRTYLGSASIMHVPTGLFVNAAGSRVKGLTILGDDPEAWQVQLGIERRLIEAGKTTAFGGYGKLKSDAGIELELFEAGLVQAIDTGATDLYLSWQALEPSAPGFDPDRVNVVVGGIRVRF
jgi:hypothetical protein